MNVNDDTTYADIAEAVVENESFENESVEAEDSQPLDVIEPPKPQARAKRVSKPKYIERTDTVVDVGTEIEPETKFVEIKAKPKRAAKVKVVETVPVVE